MFLSFFFVIFSRLQGQQQDAHKDFLTPIQQLPRQMRLMYVHAYQSHVFNRAASERMQMIADAVRARRLQRQATGGGAAGAEDEDADLYAPVVGDLVFVDRARKDAGSLLPDQAAAAAAAAAAAGSGKDRQGKGKNGGGGGGEGQGRLDMSSKEYAEHVRACVRRVTPEDVAAKRFSLADVVLPLPGTLPAARAQRGLSCLFPPSFRPAPLPPALCVSRCCDRRSMHAE